MQNLFNIYAEECIGQSVPDTRCLAHAMHDQVRIGSLSEASVEGEENAHFDIFYGSFKKKEHR